MQSLIRGRVRGSGEGLGGHAVLFPELNDSGSLAVGRERCLEFP